MNKNVTKGSKRPSGCPIYNKVGIFKFCIAALTFILAVVSGIFFGTSFDTKSMYFTSAPAPYIFGGVIAAAIIAAIILSTLSKEQIAPSKRGAATFLQYIAGLVLFCLFLQSIMSKSLWLVTFSLIAIAYFLGVFNKRIVANTFLGIGAVVFFGVAIAQTYFDYGIAVNSPYKLLCQFSMALAMYFIVSELRLELDPKLSHSRAVMYKLVSCVTLALNFSASVASILLLIKGADGIHYCFIPCLSMTLYSSKIFFARPVTVAEAQDPDTPTENTDEKGTDTDENVN